MKPETFFVDHQGRAHPTPTRAAESEIAAILNIPHVLARRIVERFDQVKRVISDARLAETAYESEIKHRTADVVVFAPRRIASIPASCRVKEGE